MEIENLPWAADIGECAKVRDSRNALIATCHYINGDGCRRGADEVARYARLIAAAPEAHDLIARAVADRIDDKWLKDARSYLAKLEVPSE